MNNETPQQAARRLSTKFLEEGFHPVALHPYTDEKGNVLYWRIRLKHPNGEKWIRPLRWIEEEKRYELSEPPFPQGKPLYNLALIVQHPDEPVWFFEGEQCADVAVKLGLIATTSGSVGTANVTDFKPLTGRQVSFWRDNDDPGLKHAQEVSERLFHLQCRVRWIDVSQLNLPPKGDIVDWLQANPKATKADIEALPFLEPEAPPPVSHQSNEAESLLIQELAGLSPVDYERRRKKEAETLGIRVTALDAAVEEKRAVKSKDNEAIVLFQEPEPWPDPVDGAQLLSDLANTLSHYVLLSEGTAEAIALWIVHTHAHGASQVSPLLCISSPEKRCGKTTLLSILQALVKKPLPASNITPAALFRATEKWRPTLLIDEADCFLADNHELRGILNSGHRRDSAFVIRTVGDDHEPRQFSTWAPKAIALIGKMHPTLTDRSLIILMRRKRTQEKVLRLRLGQMEDFVTLKRRISRWVTDSIKSLLHEDSPTPPELNDRAADNWKALFAIADLAGGEWPQKARSSALTLSLEESDEAAGVLLLEDVQKLFSEHKTSRLTSASFVESLIQMEERPWPEWSHGRPITTRQVARLLKPFGIQPKNLRVDAGVLKGYEKDQFDDAFARYLPDLSATPLQTKKDKDLGNFSSATDSFSVADEKEANPLNNEGCSDVADQNGGMEEGVWALQTALEIFPGSKVLRVME